MNNPPSSSPTNNVSRWSKYAIRPVSRYRKCMTLFTCPNESISPHYKRPNTATQITSFHNPPESTKAKVPTWIGIVTKPAYPATSFWTKNTTGQNPNELQSSKNLCERTPRPANAHDADSTAAAAPPGAEAQPPTACAPSNTRAERMHAVGWMGEGGRRGVRAMKGTGREGGRGMRRGRGMRWRRERLGEGGPLG
jgi:hypothetical protein